MFCSFKRLRFIIFPAVALGVHDPEMQAGNGVGAVFAHGGGLRHAEDHLEHGIANDSAFVQPHVKHLSPEAQMRRRKSMENCQKAKVEARVYSTVVTEGIDENEEVASAGEKWAKIRRLLPLLAKLKEPLAQLSKLVQLSEM